MNVRYTLKQFLGLSRGVPTTGEDGVVTCSPETPPVLS